MIKFESTPLLEVYVLLRLSFVKEIKVDTFSDY